VFVGHDHFGGTVGPWLGNMPRGLTLLAMSLFVRQLPRLRQPKEDKAPVVVLQELLEAGKITPVVDRTFSLGDVPAALRYLAEGQPRGKVVITI